ncbi:FHA domain-containing protein [Micromonospora sp. DT47]|uniref:FHA domain-containing protein n=1 Tax=Micromonospora sp. DT47 TaxID=3393431 RepID=UPI003CEE2C4C
MEEQLLPLLTVASGAMRGAAFRVRSNRQVIGRTPIANIVINDPHVSRQHAAVRLTDAGATLTDLGSCNGTWVNDRRIEVAELLCDGDLIRLGRVDLRFFDPGVANTERVGLSFSVGRPDIRPTLPLPVAVRPVLEQR